MSDLGHDMVSFSESLVRAQINATMWLLDDTFEMQRTVPQDPPDWASLWAFLSGDRRLDPPAEEAVRAHLEEGKRMVTRMVRRNKSRAGTRSEESAWELKAVYKAYFFFIRAFHDACYGVLLNLNGSTPGGYSSMNRCITRRISPIFEQIETIPGYIDWFMAFRRKRDLIKLGANFSLCGPAWDVGVGFNKVTPEGGVIASMDPNVNKFRLGDFVLAFRYSTAVMELMSRVIPSANTAPEADTSKGNAG